MHAWSLLGSNLALMVGVLSVAALPSFRTKDPSYIDGLWGLGFVVVALSSFLQAQGDPVRKAVLLGLTSVWGVRLAAHLFARWHLNGPDPRYLKAFGANPPAVTLWLRVFVAQGVILTLVSLPVQLGQLYDGRLTALNVLGAFVAAAGIGVEATADDQLRRFKANPDSHRQVMDRGLWAWSRHPNYFGESLTWWGIALVALQNAVTMLGLLGPVVITLLLLTRSGIGPLEKQLTQSKPQYADYVARTSAFLPRRPRGATCGGSARR